MASYRKLPPNKDGQRLWQVAVTLPVKLPSGRYKRATKTHTHKSVLKRWATELESLVAAGRWRDPRAAKLVLREWREEWLRGRITTGATNRKTGSHWRNHIGPKWGGHTLEAITRPLLKEWVADMHGRQCPRCRATPGLTRGGLLVKHTKHVPNQTLQAASDRSSAAHTAQTPRAASVCSGSGQVPGLGGWTIQGAVTHLSAMLSAAVEAGLLPANPVAGLPLPRVDPKPPFYWTHEEADRLIARLAEVGLQQDALLVELNTHIGLRPGELFGLKRQYVHLDRWLIYVIGVQTRDGWREYPKSTKSRRTVPIPPHLKDRFAAHCQPLRPDELVFPSPTGVGWDDRNWANRVLEPAVKAAGVRRGTPHDMRHTAASWLVQDGVSLYAVQTLLGHEKFATTQRYAHLQPDAFGEVIATWPAPESPPETHPTETHPDLGSEPADHPVGDPVPARGRAHPTTSTSM